MNKRYEKVVFILFCSLSAYSLERLCKLCRTILHLTLVDVFIPYPFTVTSDLLTLPSEQLKDVPESAVYTSKEFGSLELKLNRFPVFSMLTFSPYMFCIPKTHEFSEETKPALDAYQDLNALLFALKVSEEVYSFGPNADRFAAFFASEFAPAVDRKKHLHSMKEGCTASVIFISDLAVCDPVACVEPYIKPNHLLDLIFAELSPDGHSVNVCWDSLSSFASQGEASQVEQKEQLQPFVTDLMQTECFGEHPWLSQQLMLKEQDGLKALQNTLLDISQRVGHDLKELEKAPQSRSQWASLFHQQVKELFGPVCKSDHLELINALQLVMASSVALDAFAKRSRIDSAQTTTNVEKLLSRFERSLLVASQLDLKALAELNEATKCEPVLLHALREAKVLTYLDDRFLFTTYLLSLLPVQNVISTAIWSAIQELFDTGQRHCKPRPDSRGVIIPTFMTSQKLVSNLKRLIEQRRSLPSYNNVWTNQPRYRSPLVQLMKDLLDARENPNEPSPSLKGLKHHASSFGSSKWFTGFSRYIGISGTSGQAALPYTTDYIIFVVLGSLPFALARELFETVKAQTSSSPVKVRILVNRYTGGLAGLSGFFSI